VTIKLKEKIGLILEKLSCKIRILEDFLLMVTTAYSDKNNVPIGFFVQFLHDNKLGDISLYDGGLIDSMFAVQDSYFLDTNMSNQIVMQFHCFQSRSAEANHIDIKKYITNNEKDTERSFIEYMQCLITLEALSRLKIDKINDTIYVY